MIAFDIIYAELGTIVLLGLSLLSTAAGMLLARKVKLPIKDETPPTMATRGAPIPLVIGRRRIGPVIAWVQGGTGVIEPEGGVGTGKRPTGSGSQTYSSRAWHILCVGPAARLHKIWANGKVISRGIISPENSPSGTLIDLGGAGRFRIYWGEPDQPVDTLLQSTFGFASRWPFVCFVVWDTATLQGVPNWPLIEYEIEVLPRSQLTATPPWMQDTLLDAAPSAGHAVTSYVVGAVGVRKVIVQGDQTQVYLPNTVVRVSSIGSGSTGYVTAIFGGSDQTLRVHVLYSVYVNSPPPTQETHVYLAEVTRLAVGSPQTPIDGDRIAPVVSQEDDGVNLAHALDQVMFAPFPWGAGKDRGEYDVASLEELGTLVGAGGENLRGSIVVSDKDTAAAVVATLLQDLGCMISLDPQRGLFVFNPIREPGATRPTIPTEAILPPLPEVRKRHAPTPVDRISFVFPDRRLNYRDMPIVESDDGQTEYTKVQRSQEVRIHSTTHAPTARLIAYRRAQEELAQASAIRLQVARNARDLVAGTAVDAEGQDHTLRVLSTSVDPLTSKVEVHTYVDAYGLPSTMSSEATAFGTGDDLGAPPTQEYPVEDVAAAVFEVPRYISDRTMRVAIPRIRSSTAAIRAHIWMSRDSITYRKIGTTERVHRGGTLVDELPASTKWVHEGATIDALGPDIAGVEDLSADHESWRLGRQLALIGTELCFLRAISAAGGGTYTLDGLIRGRLGTDRQTHAAGTPVFIVDSQDVELWTDVLLQPGRDLYVKLQVETQDGGAISLDKVTPVEVALAGTAIRPLPPCSFRTTNRTNSWAAGADVVFRWSHRSTELPKTGAGLQGAGDPTGSSEVQGEFVLRLYDGVTLKRTVYVGESTTWTYDNAELVADFGGEPTDFEARLTQVYAGYTSAPTTITLTRT